jgi:hypothetical protein
MEPHLNIDELYESKKKSDLNRLDVFNKLLVKIHNKIKLVSRQRNSSNFCCYVIPEVFIGYPKYDIGECIGYITFKLNSDGFLTRYVHPHMLFISWNHWIPLYVRDEYKKKTGIEIDQFGNKVEKQEKESIVKFSKSIIDKSNDKSNKSYNITKNSNVYDEDFINILHKF